MLAIGYIFYCDDTDIITEKLYIFTMWFSLLTWVSLIFTLKFTFKNHCMTDVTKSDLFFILFEPVLLPPIFLSYSLLLPQQKISPLFSI